MCIERLRQAGVSLLELILAIVIIGVAMASVMSVFLVSTQHSADPMVVQQAELIAEAYLDEILAKKFYDPDTNNVCPAAEASRALYDNVCDYNMASPQAPADQFGTAIVALAAYSVQVTVSNSGVTLNGTDNTSVIRVLRVDVNVTGPNGTNLTLTGYRTNYECNASGDSGCKAL